MHSLPYNHSRCGLLACSRRSFLAALLPELPQLGSMTLAPAGGAAKTGGTGTKQAAFLRLLAQLLELDAAFVLSATQKTASSYLLKSYLEILNMRYGSGLCFAAVGMPAVPMLACLCVGCH